ncbi:MAG: ECF transporter S component [Clostridia bacterium]|nr:ECF transporter S component [Clostridia bacterium]
MKIKELTRYALFTAIIFICTYMVQITLPLPGNGGLVHAGNIALFTIAVVFGKKYGAVSGAVGMTLFDLLSGWAIWAPGTFIIRFACGYVIGAIANAKDYKGTNRNMNILAMLSGSAIIIFGYYFYQVLLYGNWVVAAGSMIGDVIQSAVGTVVSLALIPSLIKLQSIDQMSRTKELCE